MSSTPLEKLRQMYQDIEEKRKRAVRLLINQPKTVKEEAYINHHVARLCHEIQDLSKQVLEKVNEGFPRVENPVESFYEELNKRVKFHQEVSDIEPEVNIQPQAPIPEEVSMNDLVLDIKGTIHLSLFYDNDRYQEWRNQRKEQEKKRHRSHKRHIVVPENDEALSKFSGEECYGKYLDLTQIHREYLTLSGADMRYLDFLNMVNDSNNFLFIPKSPQGEKFLQNFIDYLVSFIERSHPFYDIESTMQSIHKGFLSQYRGGPKPLPPNYCHYCDRSFESPELLESHQKQRSHSKNVQRAEKLGGVDKLIEERHLRQLHYEELAYTLYQLINTVRNTLNNTIENTSRRETLTAAVIEAEQDLDSPIVFDESDSEDEQHFYNPKGLPLGWDGKPIPYWLYKLHGLSVEYKCEICGNRSYWGALAFERHFFDVRHINGLKALGIPPTRHFVYVTKVSEAVALFEKIKKTLSKEVWQKGDEEIETESGDVMSLKVYQDLVRQGIIKPKQQIQ
ncbi:Zinc finger, C2H2 type family protein [Histomonas meleagridis]|uniref:Zinc finger protein, C2H2 type family protein n=1 Tax=Histomonas meleagridis TaxID=135588 RepID=UPI00355A931C|nr:Zinc finger, C2H2 type family protein [Histomonas meleagridis]KAH0803983.1 Zinc finger protein, C2H2 type family protein [Histomonas meleagridis]